MAVDVLSLSSILWLCYSHRTSIILDIQVAEVNWRCTKGPASRCMRAPAFEVLFIYLHINSYPAWLCF